MKQWNLTNAKKRTVLYETGAGKNIVGHFKLKL